jgi:hypothetical protein
MTKCIISVPKIIIGAVYKFTNIGIFRLIITNSLSLYLSCELNTRSAGREIFCFLWNPQVHCCVHNSPIFRGFMQYFITCWFFTVNYHPLSNSQPRGPPLLSVHDCFFSISAGTLHISRPSPPSATLGCAMPWRQGTCLMWIMIIYPRYRPRRTIYLFYIRKEY